MRRIRVQAVSPRPGGGWRTDLGRERDAVSGETTGAARDERQLGRLRHVASEVSHEDPPPIGRWQNRTRGPCGPQVRLAPGCPYGRARARVAATAAAAPAVPRSAGSARD